MPKKCPQEFKRDVVRVARRAIIARRGTRAQHIATVAAARHLIKVVYYTMRDGHARCLDVPLPVAS